MELPDFQNLTLIQLVSVFLFFAAIDVLSAYGIALVNGNFSTQYAFDFIRTHIVKVGAPILILGLIGRGVPEVGIPAIPASFVFAVGLLVAYVGVTIKSVQETWTDKAEVPPKDEQ